MTDEQYEEILSKAEEKYSLIPFYGMTEEDIEYAFHRELARAGFNLGFHRGIIEGYEKGRDKAREEGA